MNTATTKAETLLSITLRRLYKHRICVNDKLNTLRNTILERWPEEQYGVRWLSKYDARSEKLRREIAITNAVIRGVENILNEIRNHPEDYII